MRKSIKVIQTEIGIYKGPIFLHAKDTTYDIVLAKKGKKIIDEALKGLILVVDGFTGTLTLT